MKWQICALILFVLCASAAQADASKRIEESFDWQAGQRVVIDFSVGSLRIEIGADDRVEVSLEAECRWSLRRCEEALEQVRIESRSNERRLSLDVETRGAWSASKLELEALIRVPRAVELDVEMGVGELEIEGVRGDVRVEMGIGEATLYLDADAVRSVDLDVGIGESQLEGPEQRVRERRSMLIGSEVSWDDGPGAARVVVELGVGEVSVFLD